MSGSSFVSVLRTLLAGHEISSRFADADFSQLLAHDYWFVWSRPNEGTTQGDIERLAVEHVTWLLELERAERVFASGPLHSGPGTAPGTGMTVLRAADEAAARRIADEDPFVRAGLRPFDVYRWRLNEGSVSVRVSLGTGTDEWG